MIYYYTRFSSLRSLCNQKRFAFILCFSYVAAEAFQDFNLIEARVPILRFKDRINGIEVDLNYNNCVGIKNTYLLQLYAQCKYRENCLRSC